MEYAILWVVLCIVVGGFAFGKGKSFFGYLVLSLLISPFVGWIIVAVQQPNAKVLEMRALKEGEVKKCPACAELILVEALKCKHCGQEFEV